MKASLFTAALAIHFASAVDEPIWRTEMPFCAQYCFVTGTDYSRNCQLGHDDKCICNESTANALRAAMKTCVEIKCERFNRKFPGQLCFILAPGVKMICMLLSVYEQSNSQAQATFGLFLPNSASQRAISTLLKQLCLVA